MLFFTIKGFYINSSNSYGVLITLSQFSIYLKSPVLAHSKSAPVKALPSILLIFLSSPLPNTYLNICNEFQLDLILFEYNRIHSNKNVFVFNYLSHYRLFSSTYRKQNSFYIHLSNNQPFQSAVSNIITFSINIISLSKITFHKLIFSSIYLQQYYIYIYFPHIYLIISFFMNLSL